MSINKINTIQRNVRISSFFFFLLFLNFADFTDQLLIEHFLCTLHTCGKYTYICGNTTLKRHTPQSYILCTTFRLSTFYAPYIIHTNSYASQTYSLCPFCCPQAPSQPTQKLLENNGVVDLHRPIVHRRISRTSGQFSLYKWERPVEYCVHTQHNGYIGIGVGKRGWWYVSVDQVHCDISARVCVFCFSEVSMGM